jgi:hypothetical protein
MQFDSSHSGNKTALSDSVKGEVDSVSMATILDIHCLSFQVLSRIVFQKLGLSGMRYREEMIETGLF